MPPNPPPDYGTDSTSRDTSAMLPKENENIKHEKIFTQNWTSDHFYFWNLSKCEDIVHHIHTIW